jgi:hypothetical protein
VSYNAESGSMYVLLFSCSLAFTKIDSVFGGCCWWWPTSVVQTADGVVCAADVGAGEISLPKVMLDSVLEFWVQIDRVLLMDMLPLGRRLRTDSSELDDFRCSLVFSRSSPLKKNKKTVLISSYEVIIFSSVKKVSLYTYCVLVKLIQFVISKLKNKF